MAVSWLNAARSGLSPGTFSPLHHSGRSVCVRGLTQTRAIQPARGPVGASGEQRGAGKKVVFKSEVPGYQRLGTFTWGSKLTVSDTQKGASLAGPSGSTAHVARGGTIDGGAKRRGPSEGRGGVETASGGWGGGGRNERYHGNPAA